MEKQIKRTTHLINQISARASPTTKDEGFHVGVENKTCWHNSCNNVAIISCIAFFDITQATRMSFLCVLKAIMVYKGYYWTQDFMNTYYIIIMFP
jgi:hypothetical protein